MAVRANCALDQSMSEVSMFAIIHNIILRITCSMDQFARYVLLFLGLRIELPQIVREEKQLEDKEHNKELDQDNQPERLA